MKTVIGAQPKQWHKWSDIATLFDGPADADWHSVMALVDHDVAHPWGVDG